MSGFSEHLAARVRDGWRVESSTGDTVVLVKGRRANHILHLLLTLVTCGLWLIVWAIVGLETGEKRIVLRQDSDGVVRHVSAGMSAFAKIGVGLVAVFVVGSCMAAVGKSGSAARTSERVPTRVDPDVKPAHFVPSKKKKRVSIAPDPTARVIEYDMVMDGPEDRVVSAVMNTRVEIPGRGLSSETVSGAFGFFRRAGGFEPKTWSVRMRKGVWEVTLSYLDGGRRRTALWTYDPVLSKISAADSNARLLSWVPEE